VNGLQSYPNCSVLSYVPADQQFNRQCKIISKMMATFFNITCIARSNEILGWKPSIVVLFKNVN
jgi:hypothetical protein